MSLSQEPTFNLLKNDFVCGWKNIATANYAGQSSAHELENPGVRTTNGAGPHNIQLFFLTPDGAVLQCMPGYWDSRDLALIINDLVKPLYTLYKSRKYARTTKSRLYKKMQLEFMSKHKAAIASRSRMQNFDVKFEITNRLADSDCFQRDENGQPIKFTNKKGKVSYKMKSTFEIALERMSKRPFVAYRSFDVAKFSDYGRKKYDKKGDGGGEEKLGQLMRGKKKKDRQKKRALRKKRRKSKADMN